MLTAAQIQSVFKSAGVSVYETHFSFDKNVDVVLKSNEIQDLLRLIQENDIKSAFYSFAYVNREDYLITDDDIPEVDAYTTGVTRAYNAFVKEFRAEQQKFNSKVLTSIADKPQALYVYCLLGGVHVGVLFEDPWHLNLPDKCEILSNLGDLLAEMYANAYSQEEAARNAILGEIKTYLDTTDEWHACTNKRLRQNYCRDLAEKYEKEHGVWVEPFRIFDALELLWNQYKNNKNK